MDQEEKAELDPLALVSGRTRIGRPHDSEQVIQITFGENIFLPLRFWHIV